MEERRAIYHKKTGILSDRLDNHILHEGSDNFTRAAHSRNAESVTFLYYSDPIDLDAIKESIIEFDEEWQDNQLTFDLSQEFLEQIIAERDRRQKLKQPVIESITPDEFPNGETTPVEITGRNLDRVETIEPHDNDLVKVTIDSREPERIIGQVEVYPDHPSTPLKNFKVKTTTGIYNVSPEKPVFVSSDLIVPEFSEIEGFKQAVELILAGKHGQPQDFLYWLAMERPHLLRVQQSGILDELVYQGILFEHQKSGAQHCLRVMQDFGVAVCADAVGLGKTRLAASVAKLYRSEKGSARIAVIAAKKLFPNWEREMTELGFKESDYELYNKNLMSLKGNRFLDEFNRYGG
ncbi:MAG: helicase-related protein, partial [Microcystaceae cyanobacterium]